MDGHTLLSVFLLALLIILSDVISSRSLKPDINIQCKIRKTTNIVLWDGCLTVRVHIQHPLWKTTWHKCVQNTAADSPSQFFVGYIWYTTATFSKSSLTIIVIDFGPYFNFNPPGLIFQRELATWLHSCYVRWNGFAARISKLSLVLQATTFVQIISLVGRIETTRIGELNKEPEACLGWPPYLFFQRIYFIFICSCFSFWSLLRRQWKITWSSLSPNHSFSPQPQKPSKYATRQFTVRAPYFVQFSFPTFSQTRKHS